MLIIIFIVCISSNFWLLLLCRVIITNQTLVDREGSLYYYLSLTPRVSLSSPPQSAVQVSMSMVWTQIDSSHSQRLNSGKPLGTPVHRWLVLSNWVVSKRDAPKGNLTTLDVWRSHVMVPLGLFASHAQTCSYSSLSIVLRYVYYRIERVRAWRREQTSYVLSIMLCATRVYLGLTRDNHSHNGFIHHVYVCYLTITILLRMKNLTYRPYIISNLWTYAFWHCARYKCRWTHEHLIKQLWFVKLYCVMISVLHTKVCKKYIIFTWFA